MFKYIYRTFILATLILLMYSPLSFSADCSVSSHPVSGSFSFINVDGTVHANIDGCDYVLPAGSPVPVYTPAPSSGDYSVSMSSEDQWYPTGNAGIAVSDNFSPGPSGTSSQQPPDNISVTADRLTKFCTQFNGWCDSDNLPTDYHSAHWDTYNAALNIGLDPCLVLDCYASGPQKAPETVSGPARPATVPVDLKPSEPSFDKPVTLDPPDLKPFNAGTGDSHARIQFDFSLSSFQNIQKQKQNMLNHSRVLTYYEVSQLHSDYKEFEADYIRQAEYEGAIPRICPASGASALTSCLDARNRYIMDFRNNYYQRLLDHLVIDDPDYFTAADYSAGRTKCMIDKRYCSRPVAPSPSFSPDLTPSPSLVFSGGSPGDNTGSHNGSVSGSGGNVNPSYSFSETTYTGSSDNGSGNDTGNGSVSGSGSNIAPSDSYSGTVYNGIGDNGSGNDAGNGNGDVVDAVNSFHQEFTQIFGDKDGSDTGNTLDANEIAGDMGLLAPESDITEALKKIIDAVPVPDMDFSKEFTSIFESIPGKCQPFSFQINMPLPFDFQLHKELTAAPFCYFWDKYARSILTFAFDFITALGIYKIFVRGLRRV